MSDIRERNDRSKDKQPKYQVTSNVQCQMVQKFVKELNDSVKQPDRSDSAEHTATEQVETAAREIVHEAMRLSHNTGQYPVHDKSTDFPSYADALRERVNNIRTKPESPPQHTPAPTPQEQARNAVVRRAKKTDVETPDQPALPNMSDGLPLQKQLRERTDDLKTRTEFTQPQKSAKKLPQEQPRRAFLKQKQSSRTEDFSVRDSLLTGTPEIRENPHFPEHGAVPTKAAPDSHIRQAGAWTPRSEITQIVTSEQTPTISARDVPPTPQARMRDAFVKTQKQRAQNPSIESINLSEQAAPILPQPPVADAPAITPERQPVTAGSGKPASPAPQPVHPIAPPQIQPPEHLPSIREKPTPNAAPREASRRGADIRTRDTEQISAPKAQSKPSVSKTATKRARKAATQDAQRKMLQKSNRTAKTEKATAKKLGEAAAKATKELLSTLVSLGGGAALLVLFCVIVVVGAFLSSPLGILFADEQQMEDTVPLATAIAEIQGEYHAELEQLQNGELSSVQLIGQAPDWREVVAVFASKTAGAEDGMDVFTLDEERVALLREVFWDMCQLETQTETVQHEDGERSTALTIAITAKTAAQMRLEYDFSKYQNDALDILLENLGSLNVPMGSLTISQEDAITLLENLPDDLDPARTAVVETAVQLVGKVSYFWGGKSLTLGWDDRWGTPMEVTAVGSGSTGTIRPFGLDCSGFVDWTFYNATNGAYYPGRGGGAATQHSYCTDILWSEAQPGDLVFYPDDSHVGIVGGWDTDGNLLIVHCSGGANGVVITGAAGFTAVARPDCFAML